MDSNEKNLGAGWGGGGVAPTKVETHDDVRIVHGDFGRTADCIQFLADTRDGGTSSPSVALAAAGDNALIQLTAESTLLLETRQPGDPVGAITDKAIDTFDIFISATKGGGILIRRGLRDDPNMQAITMESDQEMGISAGQNGLVLQSGGSVSSPADSYILITPSSIELKAATITINGEFVQINN